MAQAVGTDTHPLDPLSAAEIAAAVAAVRRDHDPDGRLRVISVDLDEPGKPELRAWRAGGERPARRAALILLDPGRGETYEAVVWLSDERPVSWAHVPGVHPPITSDEFMEAERVVKADSRYREALARRGITELELVLVDPWSVGRFEDPDRRLARALSWLRTDLVGDNAYARPIGGLAAVVDLNEMRVVRIDDHGALPVQSLDGDYRHGDQGRFRDDLRPLRITQPEGPSFTVDGNRVCWQKWQFRVGFSRREALVLHELGYEDGGHVRSVCHRASFAELVIPYGDPNPTVHFKNAFDIGEYGIGELVNALERGCDCLGEIHYFDAVTNDTRGGVLRLPNAICLHEEDYGVLWKHVDARSGETDVRRSRRLVVSTIATVGNYEYGFFWYLYQDGTVGCEAKLTGVLHTAGVRPGLPQKHGIEVAPGVVASNHQHFFCVRLDMDVDGERNRVVELESAADPIGSDNPEGHAFSARRTVLRSELQAQRLVNPLAARRWRVENTERLNRIGEPVAYELVPGDNVLPMAHEDAQMVRRARFITRHLWVTPYSPSERYPAGEYPNQHDGDDGLPRWTAADRAIEDEDVVLWYVFGAHHLPRLEDWPVMPVVHCGFHLRPVGFFDRNPALDVPPPGSCAHE